MEYSAIHRGVAPGVCGKWLETSGSGVPTGTTQMHIRAIGEAISRCHWKGNTAHCVEARSSSMFPTTSAVPAGIIGAQKFATALQVFAWPGILSSELSVRGSVLEMDR